MGSSLRTYDELLIGGGWIKSHSGRTIDSINPATGDVWATVPEADEVDVGNAVEAARMALKGRWRTMVPSERGKLIRNLADALSRQAETLAELESTDNGKPFRDTVAEIRRSAEWFYYYAGVADKIEGATIPLKAGTLAYTVREPVGVVAAITPWNSPISMYSWKLGPALAAGCTVVLKPAEQTSVTAMELGKLFLQCGFPEGVLNIVPGYGTVTGRALVRHPGVDKVAFTGEHSTAQEIMKGGAVGLKRMSMECGGKSPNIIFADANLGKAIVVAVQSAFRSTGQSCSLGSRLFVEDAVYNRVVDEVVRRAQKIRVGMPMDPSTHIGPQTSQQQLDKTLSYVKIGVEEGASLLQGGKRPPHLKGGYFIEPTVFGAVDNQSRLAQEEIFGPVLSIIPFKSEGEVIEMANDTKYGLVGAVWTRDISRALRVANNIQAGFVTVNTYRPVHWALPYGGYKISGIGRENGLEAMNEYTEVKTFVVDYSDSQVRDPFEV
jgi:acyl-CoA reductase-like NAD-dependent aldehyde dehydrogenase